MKIAEITKNKKKYLSLLLLADEQEDMIDRYLDRGTMFVLDNDGVKSECVVTDEGSGVLEIKNIATAPKCQGLGYGRLLIEYIADKYKNDFSVLQVGTGDSPLTIPFYEKCGFVRSYIVKNFFTDNYDHPIYECGIQLTDMIYLQRKLT
ncbi:MAG: GNAT family N-acetyltransferase [Ruminococcus sp.]|nr:GNAT family N-acetyltransferase [Ruminococcus sp.]